MPNGLQPRRTTPGIRAPSAGVGGIPAGAESPTNLGTSLDLGGILSGLGSLTAGGIFAKSLFDFSKTQFPELGLPGQAFGEEEARLLSGELGAQLRSAGMSSLERTGLESPSRVLGIQRAAGAAEKSTLAKLLSRIDQTNLQRALAQFQTGAARQERKGDILGTVGDIAGTAATLIPGAGPLVGAGIKGVTSLFKGIF